MVDLADVQRKEQRSKQISLRTYPSYFAWLEEYDVSPTELFNAAVEELMGKDAKNAHGPKKTNSTKSKKQSRKKPKKRRAKKQRQQQPAQLEDLQWEEPLQEEQSERR